ncbi:MAG: NADH-quinone oxidoreductase subunit C [Candidatus Adiutrix sp.]|jgi:NADH-quinone oxidoreductase subunit C|nr:NADH-quinone oxidoreductase subunit C [Candidatus Adiutrix sp.]
MSAGDLYESWRALGALVLSRHDFKKTGLTVSAVFRPAAIVAAARELYAAGYFLENLSALEAKEGLLVTWHFDSAGKPGRVALRALAGGDNSLPSLHGVYQGAEWHEREAADFFGLRFTGNPNPVPLLLPHDFAGPPPLLKEDGALAALADLKIFGEAEALDPAWRAIVDPASAAKEGGAA